MEEKILGHIKQLEGKNRSERNKYLKKVISNLGFNYLSHEFKSGFTKGENIIVNLSAEAEKFLVLSAHYDPAPRSPGANDNSSSVATLLAVLEKIREKLGIPVKFIFFDLEEKMPLTCGSRAYVKDFGTKNINFLLNLEMVGIGDVAMIWVDENERESEEVDLILKVFREQSTETIFAKTAMPMTFLGYPRLTTDHEPFVKSGFVKAFSVTMLPKEDLSFREILEKKKIFHFIKSAFQYSLFRTGDYPKILRHYHRKEDSLEYIERKSLHIVSEAIIKIIDTFENYQFSIAIRE